MGVRFECPNGHQLNVKAHLSGKRGICPACGARFVVPAFSGGRVPEVLEVPTAVGAAVGDSGNDLAADAAWYVRPAAGGQFGPVDSDVFQQWVREGRVAADSWVWRSGWAEWKPGRDVLAGSDSSLGGSAIKSTDSSINVMTVPGPASLDDVPAPRPGEAMSMARRRRQQLNHRLTIILGLVAVVLIVVMAVVLRR